MDHNLRSHSSASGREEQGRKEGIEEGGGNGGNGGRSGKV